MKLSKYLIKTLKESPKDAEFKSHKLLVRGGYIKQISAGIFTYFPLAWRSLKKIEAIIREEMDAIDYMEINMPVTIPSSLWSETGRYETVGDELLRFEDRVGRKMVLGMTHEEVVTDLIRYAVQSYKQLPVKVYQIQTKFRDEPRVRGGLIRVREFTMKDAYSFHDTYEDLEIAYQEAYEAYHRIFKRCGLPAIAVSSDVGMMGGSGADEFMAVTEAGEDTLVICSSCDYKANKEVATAKRDVLQEALLPMEEVETKGKMTIEEVSAYLNIPTSKTMKALVYSTGDELVMCVIRGDLEINETKLRNYLGAKIVVLATDHELSSAGIVRGYASPVGQKIKIVADLTVKATNLVGGANKPDYHTINCNINRDWTTEFVVDIAAVNEGESCPECGASLGVHRGIEIGNIFRLGTKYSSDMKARFLDKDGKEKDMIMGCYGIGVGRLMASVLEVKADENKIIWPISIAPFEVSLLGLYKSEGNVKDICDTLYSSMKEQGIDVLYDDRSFSPGFKFKDADLIGSPIVVSVGEKSLEQGGVELTVGKSEKIIVAVDKIIEEIKAVRKRLFDETRE